MIKQPFWKRWLSHLYEFRIEEAKSEFSEKLEITFRQGRYTLSTTEAVYSFDDLYFNFRHSFEKLELDKLKIRRVLVLGLGLGSIPILLERVFRKHYDYTLVEIDPQVIAFAQKYGFGASGLQSACEVHCADAYDFVLNCKQQFDLIAVDIFINDLIPSKFEKEFFLAACQKILSPKGLLMYNRLTYSPALSQKTDVFFKKTFQKVFPAAFFYEIKGNKMLINKHI